MIEICEQEPYLSESRRAAIIKAKDNGLVVFDFTEAVGSIVSLDLDEPPVGKQIGFRTTSKSGRQHGFVLIDTTDAPGYAAQKHLDEAINLGSDHVREEASYCNYPNPGSYLMFETAEGARELRSWLASLPEGLRKLVKEL